jgi:hypothetical protein
VTRHVGYPMTAANNHKTAPSEHILVIRVERALRALGLNPTRAGTDPEDPSRVFVVLDGYEPVHNAMVGVRVRETEQVIDIFCSSPVPVPYRFGSCNAQEERIHSVVDQIFRKIIPLHLMSQLEAEAARCRVELDRTVYVRVGEGDLYLLVWPLQAALLTSVDPLGDGIGLITALAVGISARAMFSTSTAIQTEMVLKRTARSAKHGRPIQ